MKTSTEDNKYISVKGTYYKIIRELDNYYIVRNLSTLYKDKMNKQDVNLVPESTVPFFLRD